MAFDDINNDEIRKEIYYQNKEIWELVGSLKGIPDKLNDLIASQNDMKSSLGTLSSRMENVENSLNSDIKSKIQAIENAQSTTNQTLESLKAFQTSTSESLGNLSAQVSQIVETKIPELENKIAQGGEKPWVLIYDKSSADPALNRGATSGLHKDNYKDCIASYDFMPYNKLRFYFAPGLTSYSVFEFDISKTKYDKSYQYLIHSVTDAPVLVYTYAETILNGSQCNLMLGRTYRWYFSGTKFVKDEVTGTLFLSYHIAKIEGQI